MPMPAPPSPIRVYFLPFPSPGHAIPMVDIAKLFAKRNVECTLILTPLNASRFKSAIRQHNLKLETFQFPSVDGLPAGNGSADALEQPFRELIRNNPPDAIVSDALLPWAAMGSAELNIPHYSFSSTGCFALSVERSLVLYRLQQNVTSDSDLDPFLVPGVPDEIYMAKSQLAKAANSGEKENGFFNRYREAERSTDGWVVNTCSAFERAYIKHFERETCKPVFAVGPVCISGTSKHDILERGYGEDLMAKSERLLGWLDGRPAFSVVYVCVDDGMSRMSKAQLREIGFGLIDSGVPFIWAVGGCNNSDDDDVADDVAAAAGISGQVVKGWAPQFALLLHAAVGMFVTHCGWNSVMEAVASGSLILTWPLHKQQFYNEKFVVELARIGASMRVETHDDGAVLGRRRVAERVRWAHGAESEDVRKRAWDVGLMARMEFLKGGSSFATADCLIDHARCSKEKKILKMEASDRTV